MLRQLSYTPKYRKRRIPSEINLKNSSMTKKIQIKDYLSENSFNKNIKPMNKKIKKELFYPENKILKRSQSSKTFLSSNLSTGVNSPNIQSYISNLNSVNNNDDVNLQLLNSNNSNSFKTFRKNSLRRSDSYLNFCKTYNRKKFIDQFLKCVCFDNFNKKITKKEIKEVEENVDNNLSILSNWIDEINNKGFKRNGSLIFDKKKEINKISEKLNYINSELNRSKRNIDKVYIVKENILKENKEIRNKYKSISTEKKKNENEINKTKKEIEKIQEQIKKLKRETILIGGEAINLNNQINYFELEIQKLNLLISEKMKEIEKIGNMKNIIDKGIKSAKYKINDKIKNSNSFMLNVNELLLNENLFDSK